MGRWKLLKSKRDISLFMRAVRYMIVLVLVFPWSLVFGAAILSKCL